MVDFDLEAPHVRREREFFVGVGFLPAVSFLPFRIIQHAPLFVKRRLRYHPALESIVTSDRCQANYPSSSILIESIFFLFGVAFVPSFHLFSRIPSKPSLTVFLPSPILFIVPKLGNMNIFPLSPFFFQSVSNEQRPNVT